jgi:glycosyltransferase involved in cell wall biosynthesis
MKKYTFINIFFLFLNLFYFYIYNNFKSSINIKITELQKNYQKLNQDYIDIEKNEKSKVINKIKKNLNEYYFPLKNNYTINKFKILISKYNSKEDFFYKQKPILSIIIPLYNGEKTLLNGLLSIEVQNEKNIEIIYVDDYSIDNSKKIIKEIQKIDKRIILYENEKNKGIFYTRCYGINKARGKYILTLDQDDLYVNKNLFNILLNTAEENKLDIVNFEFVILKNKLDFQNMFSKPNFNKIINKKELNNIKNILNFEFSFFTWDKLVKKNIYNKALDLIGKENLNILINTVEDVTITSSLFKIANNYMKIKLYGHCYIKSEFQTSDIYYKMKTKQINNINQKEIDNFINSFFESLKILYKISGNTTEEKSLLFKRLFYQVKLPIYEKKIENNYTKNLVLEVTNIFIKSKFFNDKEINSIKEFIKKFKINNNIL